MLVHPNAIAEYGLRCLKAGKHVLLEKPIARSSEQIAELKAAALIAGRVCMPSHNYIYEQIFARPSDGLMPAISVGCLVSG